MAILNVTAPSGAHFEFDEVRTAKGTRSLGEVPLLTWDDVDGLTAHYGNQAVLDMVNGTSARVVYQGIARRLRLQGKSDDEIAQAQVDYRPGRRVVGGATPVSRAARAAKAAAERVSGDKIAAFLERVARGEISEEDLAVFAEAK
jgi:hypothetical protein